MNNYSSEDKIQILWYLCREYSDNIMFDIQNKEDNRKFILPIILLRDSAYLPFIYKGMEIKPRHMG